MEKLEYLARTLSRTSRKDYENYVVNAVWNRLDDSEVQPVSQKLVAIDPRSRYFIDLYFPQLNMGIECNEPYHATRSEQDAGRTITIFDVLHQVQPNSGYQQFDIDVFVRDHTGNVQWAPLEAVDNAIDDVVGKLRARIETLRQSGGFSPWVIEPDDPFAYFQNRDEISMADDIGFANIATVCNSILGSSYSLESRGPRKSCFVPSSLRSIYGSEYLVWFPKKAVAGHAVSRGWNNMLSDDGLSLDEYNEDWNAIDSATGQKRVVFIQAVDPVTRVRAYRFAGVFLRDGVSEIGGVPRKHYRRISDKFTVVHG